MASVVWRENAIKGGLSSGRRKEYLQWSLNQTQIASCRTRWIKIEKKSCIEKNCHLNRYHTHISENGNCFFSFSMFYTYFQQILVERWFFNYFYILIIIRNKLKSKLENFMFLLNLFRKIFVYFCIGIEFVLLKKVFILFPIS